MNINGVPVTFEVESFDDAPCYFGELSEEMQLVVADWLQHIEEERNEFYCSERLTFGDIEEVECRRRDGFIPHSWNKGGLELQAYASQFDFWIGELSLSGKAGRVVKSVIKTSLQFASENFLDKYTEEMKAIGITKPSQISYQKLVDKGSDLAEEFCEFEDENLRSDQESTLHQIRVVFTGIDTFQIDVMHRISDAPYHRTCDGFKTFEVKAKDAETLIKGLSKISDKVLKAFV